jgi:methionyl-tRNA formyltransferase
MKIVLFAHQNWGTKSIETILSTSHEILHVFTHPIDMDKNEKVWYDSVKEKCITNNIPVSERISINDEDVSFILNLKPDLILSLGWRRLLPNSIYSFPSYGTINLHDGLLPKYRGFAPINWALINNEKEAGLTFHYIDDSADTGNIILQTKTKIEKNDTAKNVYDKLLAKIPDFILKLFSLVESNNIPTIHQTSSEGFFCARRFPEDGKINWNQDRLKIFNLIRALSDPYPNAFFIYDDEKFFIKTAVLFEEDFRGEFGKICAILKNGIIITCGNDYSSNQAILLSEIEDSSGKKIPFDFFKLWKKFT